MIRRDKFFEIGGYDMSLQSSNDWDLWLRMSRKWKLACLNWPCAWVRRHGGNLSSTPAEIESNLEIVEKALQTGEIIIPDVLTDILRRQYGYLRGYIANCLTCAASSDWVEKLGFYARRLTRTQRLILFLAARITPFTRLVIIIRCRWRVGKERSPGRFRVAIIGTWNWLEVAAELFRRAGINYQIVDIRSRQDYLRWIMKGGWRAFDAIHHLGGKERFPGLVFRMLGMPVVWHWIGSDVSNFRKIWRGGGGVRGAVDRRISFRWGRAHLADSPELASELAEFGITAPVVRLLPKAVEVPLEPLPPKPVALSYWNPSSRDLYQSSLVMHLAASMPELTFLIVGDDGAGIHPLPNVKFLGRLPNLDDVYSQVSIYIRLVKHDSLSAMVLEALARGRYVIYSKPFPHAEMATTFDQTRAALVRLVEQTRPNEEGAAYVKSHYSLQEQVNFLKRWYAQEFGVSAGSVLG
jgi:glycosyltransferase involved in cell wall biosynthesis